MENKKKELAKLIDDVIELLEMITAERKNNTNNTAIGNMNTFGNHIQDSIKEYEKQQGYEDNIWAQSIDFNEKYDFTLIKNKKIEKGEEW